MSSVGIQFNPSTLKVHYNNATEKAIVSSYEYGEDCCCFLDPDTPGWDSVTSYSLGDIVEHGSYGTYRSKTDNNLNHPPFTNPDWWTKISDMVSCNNPDWDAYTGYGGIGKTPKYLRVDFNGIGGYGGVSGWCQDPPGPNRTFVVKQYPAHSPCYYFCMTKPTIEGCYHVRIVLGANGAWCHTRLYNEWTPGWINNFSYVVGMYIRTGDAYYACTQNHTSSLDSRPEDGPDWTDYWEYAGSSCDDDWCGGDAFVSGCYIGDQLCSQWHPGYTQTNYYYVGNLIEGTDNNSYVCIQAHSASIVRKPVTGEFWADYWQLYTGDIQVCRTHLCALNELHCNWPAYNEWNPYGAGHELVSDGNGSAIVRVGNKVSSWISGRDYVIGNAVIGSDSAVYLCIVVHTSSMDNRPTTGPSWTTYWTISLGCD